MYNEILWIVFLLVDLSLALVAYYLWGRVGLYAVAVLGAFVCNLQVLMTVRLFGLVATLGNVVYGSIFFSTDLLSELHGRREARRAIWLGFFGLVSATIAMQFAIRFRPDASDMIKPHLVAVFSLMPRVVVASIGAYLISQHHDVWAFHFWKRRTKGRHLWLRNNLSTMVSQLIDTTVFTFIAFWGRFAPEVFWQIFLTTYVFKWVVAALDTPFLYLGRHLHRRRSRPAGEDLQTPTSG